MCGYQQRYRPARDGGDVAGEVPAYLARTTSRHRAVMAPSTVARRLIGKPKMLSLRRGLARGQRPGSITRRFRMHPETGTLWMASGPIILYAHRLPDTMSFCCSSRYRRRLRGVWVPSRRYGKNLNAAHGEHHTGPSPPATSSRRMELGAHGPARMHIVCGGNDGGRRRLALEAQCIVTLVGTASRAKVERCWRRVAASRGSAAARVLRWARARWYRTATERIGSTCDERFGDDSTSRI